MVGQILVLVALWQIFQTRTHLATTFSEEKTVCKGLFGGDREQLDREASQMESTKSCGPFGTASHVQSSGIAAPNSQLSQHDLVLSGMPYKQWSEVYPLQTVSGTLVGGFLATDLLFF